MPNEATATQTTTPPPNAEEHNKAIAAKLLSQDISGQSTAGGGPSNTGDALDKLFKEAQDKKAAVPVESKDGDDPPTGDEPKAGDQPDKTGTEPKLGDQPDKIGTEPKAGDAPKSKIDDAVQKRADDIFKDSPSLPTGASPKSAEAFASVKIKAAQEIAKLEQQVQELTKSQAELSEKLRNPVPDEVTRELNELRQFRAKLDVELDPKFKEYDKAVTQAQEFIYSQLKKSPAINDDVIAEIKKHGGPENVKMDKIFAAIGDQQIQRLVETKLADIEQQKFNKEQAIRSTKENIGQYLTEREKSYKDAASSHNKATQAELTKLTGALDWFKPRKVEAGADDATKAEVEDHNKFVTQTSQQLNEALNDDSPEMRAIMLTGMAQLFNLQRVHARGRAALEAEKKKSAELQTLVDRLKNASKSRLQESSAPPVKTADQVKKSEIFHTRTGDALDSIRDQIIEARAKAAGQGQ